MRHFPQPGSVTVAEINKNLITAEMISADETNETHEKILGVVFRSIPYLSYDPAFDRGRELPVNGFFYGPLKSLLGPGDVKLLPHVDLKSVSWHQKMDLLAFVSAQNQVTICDYGYPVELEQLTGTSRQNSCFGEGNNPCILVNNLQREAKILEWRPNAGMTLSVGCKGGICIWAGLYPGNAACVRPGVISGWPVGGCGVSWTLVDFLRGNGNERISALSWSPDGSYVAYASCDSSSFTIWDFAEGLGTSIPQGSGSISVLKWSPTGDYLFAAKFDGTYIIWQTNRWAPLMQLSLGEFVTGAAWNPSGTMILLAFSNSLTLNSIEFVTKPSRGAQLLPVELPELRSLTNSRVIEKIAWNATGERLAMSYKDGNELHRGLIAIYDVKRDTLSLAIASLIFCATKKVGQGITLDLLSVQKTGFIRGPGANPKPLTFSFHDKYRQGPLLSVCWSTGFCVTYPLVIREQILLH